MAEHNEIGTKGEQLAWQYLSKRGFELLEQNWRWQKSELDIIARNGEWLVFVEVKTRQRGCAADPEEAITLKKQRQLIKGANAYVTLSGNDLECRFDVISVVLNRNSAKIKHYAHAFYPRP